MTLFCVHTALLAVVRLFLSVSTWSSLGLNPLAAYGTRTYNFGGDVRLKYNEGVTGAAGW